MTRPGGSREPVFPRPYYSLPRSGRSRFTSVVRPFPPIIRLIYLHAERTQHRLTFSARFMCLARPACGPPPSSARADKRPRFEVRHVLVAYVRRQCKRSSHGDANQTNIFIRFAYTITKAQGCIWKFCFPGQ